MLVSSLWYKTQVSLTVPIVSSFKLVEGTAGHSAFVLPVVPRFGRFLLLSICAHPTHTNYVLVDLSSWSFHLLEVSFSLSFFPSSSSSLFFSPLFYSLTY